MQLQRRGYIHLTICSMVCLRITGLAGTHENELNDIYLSYALNRSIYFKTRDISVKEGLSTVQFYVCTAIVMLLLLSTITCAGNMKGESRSLAKSLKGAGISAFDTGIARTTELALCI
ncbi:MAG: hypothetical protein ACLS9K_00920 [Lachnospira eligens]